MLLRFVNHISSNGKAMLLARPFARRNGCALVLRVASSNSKSGSTINTDKHVHQHQKPSGKQYDNMSDKQLSAVQGLQGKPVHDFSPAWSREGTGQEMAPMGSVMTMHETQNSNGIQPQEMVQTDTYQHSSNVSLYGVMQSQVPDPYSSSPTHLNMPSGGESLQHKYISGMQNETHPRHNFNTISKHTIQENIAKSSSKVGTAKPDKTNTIVQAAPTTDNTSSDLKLAGSSGSNGQSGTEKTLSQTDKLKRAVKEYGATVVVFHIGISLVSLGGFYALVSSGIDVVSILQKLGVGESILSSRIATGASTFVMAYAVHKVFAPVRIAITLTSTPFIVRYLRMKGILKAPKIKS